MARPKMPTKPPTLTASAQIYHNNARRSPHTDRNEIAKDWQREAYRHTNICGEARYSATLFAAIAGRAEIGISEGQSLGRKPVWVNSGPEVDLLTEIAPTVRDRSKLIRDFMLHFIIAGECYLVARDRTDVDPMGSGDVWEVVAVTELRKVGQKWQVRHENNNYVDLTDDDVIVRLWNPDPENRQEAWSPFRSMLPTLREIEWLTQHIFAQVKSRLMGAGVWFLPDNLTFPKPPPEAVNGGAEALAMMNEAEQFMVSLATSSMAEMNADDVAFPTVVMADPAALERIDPSKLIKFWSEIDDKAMVLRSDAVRRFALGMDLPPEQVLGSSGLAVTGAGGSAGSVNHWGVWANEEQTISAHVEPALDIFVGSLTHAVLRSAIENSAKVIAYDTASLRLRQDRSKEAMEWYDRGILKAEVALRENGFDPQNDRMNEAEFRQWLLTRVAGGSATPEQVNESLRLLGVILNVDLGKGSEPAPGQPGRNRPPSLEDHPYEGPPRVDHEHNDAPFASLVAASEVLVLRALEKAGNRLLNDGKRGKDRDRTTPPHLAHLTASVETTPEFDFSLLPTALGHLPAARQARIRLALNRYCADLYGEQQAHTRQALAFALEGL